MGRLKEKKKQKKMEKVAVCPISVYNVSSILELLFECYSVRNHFKTMVRAIKRLKLSPLRRVQAFPMYGALGRSAPFLHRESTDSLIIQV